MAKKCLYCYETLDNETDFHQKCSQTFFGSKKQPLVPYTLDQMTELAKEVVERSVAVPGVQAKLSMSLVREVQKSTNGRLTVVGALGGNYIFKPPNQEFEQMPENEHLTMRIAESFGINTVPSSLIRLSSGEIAYITKRVDRTEDGQKLHMLDMFQITEAFDKYRSSMEKIGKAIHEYSENTLLDKVFLFELTLFSFLTGNNDMHLKNFSMINGSTGWVLAPAYDLLNVSIIIPEDSEELALTVEGRKKNLTRANFESFGKGIGLTERQIERVFDRMISNKTKALRLVNNSLLSAKNIQKYVSVLELRYQTLFG
ncbi:HipA domain-containing protein [uncultured Roseivirga sp.]|uniref:HipA domain-containing protein n=1 Tax=uncultured Roseivirga sp. TaxID=543088 RepID=UPI000D7A1B2A|nr:HipA domain-containing protein [uncultured Roseivirga sp.]PWL29003.1 MAG: phosphatidylinositol kinase [Roseivirga sp. XM-24bin3]